MHKTLIVQSGASSSLKNCTVKIAGALWLYAAAQAAFVAAAVASLAAGAAGAAADAGVAAALAAAAAGASVAAVAAGAAAYAARAQRSEAQQRAAPRHTQSQPIFCWEKSLGVLATLVAECRKAGPD
jgi:hypothetical protein